MVATATRPKWLALLALALVVVSLFVWAGNWQWNRAREEAPQAESITSQPARDLASVLQPQQRLTGEALEAPVVARGSYDVAHTVRVTPKPRPGGMDLGQWVVVPLVTGDGGRLPVLLGWIEGDDPADAAAVVDAVPAGPVEVSGVLQQPEEPAGSAGEATYATLSTAQLVNDWAPPLYTAYLLPSETPSGLVAVPVPDPPRQGLALQNLSYALQWFAFAIFAVVIWFRMVRDEYRDEVDDHNAELERARLSRDSTG